MHIFNERKYRLWALAALPVVIIIVGVPALLFFWRQSMTLRLASFSWQREIRIEDFSPRQERAWCRNMPSDAYDVSRKWEYEDSTEIWAGKSCTTIGDNEICTDHYTTVDHYAWRCYFTVDRWRYARSAFARGDNRTDPLPHDPATQIEETCEEIGCERALPTIEHYFLHFVDDDTQDYSCEVPRQKWDALRANTTWRVQVGVLTHWPDCESMKES